MLSKYKPQSLSWGAIYSLSATPCKNSLPVIVKALISQFLKNKVELHQKEHI